MSKAISRRDFMKVTGVVGAAGLLAACGGNSSSTAASSSVASAPAASADESLALSDGPVSMTISWWGGDSRHEAYQNAIKEFQAEHSNITIEPTFAAWSGWEEKMAAAFIAGNAQDVCQVNWNWLYNYSADGSKFVDLNTVSNFLDLTQWDKAAMDACYVANSQQCVPVSMTGRIFFWNMTTFNKAGITEVPTTWDAFLADCEAIKANGISPVYYSGVDTWTLQFFALMGWYSDYAPEDAQAFADAMSTNQKHWSDMNGFIDSIGKIKELVDLGYVQETYLSDTYQQAQQALLDGTCAFYAQGDWVVGELEKIDADKTASSIGAFLIPLADHLYCGVGVNKGFYVSKNGKNPELAQKVMEALVSPEAQQAYFDAQSGIPIANGVTADLKGPYADIKNILDTADLSPQWTDFCKYSKGPLETYISEVLVGTKTPADVAAALDADFAKAAIDAGDPNWN